MKRLSLCGLFMLSVMLVKAQDKFTNFGNFQTFPGANVTFFGDFGNNGTFVDGANTITVTFNGTAAQAISGTSATTFYKLVANNTAGVTLQQDVTISNTLTLTVGKLDLNSKTLTINNAATTALSRTSGYIVSEQTNNSGKVKWNIGATTGAHVFPFGTAAAGYVPFTLNLTGGNIGNVTVSTYPTAASNTPLPATPVAVGNINRNGVDNSANVVDRFWQIDKDGPNGTATITFTVTAAEAGTITDFQAQRWNSASSKWDDALPGQISNATSVTVPGVTSFSPWALSGNSMSLPVELLSFTAVPVDNGVSVDWKTASEINNDYYTVQRSENGLQFSDIGKVAAGAQGTLVQRYNFMDRYPLPGKSYYRLKQTDIDGTYTYSDVKLVQRDKVLASLSAYPNPATNGEFSLAFGDALESAATVVVYNLQGRVVFSGVIDQGVQIYPISLAEAPAGAYVVKASNPQVTLQQVVVVK